MHSPLLFQISDQQVEDHVSIVDKDSRTYAKIKQNYLSTDHDRMIAAKGLKLTRKIIMESETFKKYGPQKNTDLAFI